MRAGCQASSTAPFLLEQGSGSLSIQRMDEFSIHVYIHLPEKRSSFVDDAQGLPGEVQSTRGADLLGQFKRTP